MARPRSSTLTEGEQRMMELIWRLGEASVQDVTDALATSASPVAYTTALTMLRILSDKKYVEFRKAGKAHLYVPLVPRDAARSAALKQLLRRIFRRLAGRARPAPAARRGHRPARARPTQCKGSTGQREATQMNGPTAYWIVESGVRQLWVSALIAGLVCAGPWPRGHGANVNAYMPADGTPLVNAARPKSAGTRMS